MRCMLKSLDSSAVSQIVCVLATWVLVHAAIHRRPRTPCSSAQPASMDTASTHSSDSLVLEPSSAGRVPVRRLLESHLWQGRAHSGQLGMLNMLRVSCECTAVAGVCHCQRALPVSQTGLTGLLPVRLLVSLFNMTSLTD
jgi:hypothetical protein